MQLKISDLLSDPDHYFFQIEGENALFLHMDRAAYARSVFFDQRIAPASDRMLQVPLAQLAAHAQQRGLSSPDIGWIFHIAHCGSTLLARALEQGAGNLIVREPVPLRQLGVAAANGQGASAEWQAQLRLAVALLNRRYGRLSPVVVKANVPVNMMLSGLMTLNPAMPAILLYFTFDNYLLAILKSAGHRGWVGSVSGELGPAISVLAGDARQLGVAEQAAALWLAQMRVFADALARFPNSHSLDAEMLFGRPRETVTASLELFGLDAAADTVDAIMARELFATYAKSPAATAGSAAPAAYNNKDRLAVQTEQRRKLAPELGAARRWLDRQLSDRPLPVSLARSLVGESPPLLG